MKLNELHYVCFDETEQLQGTFGMMFKTEEEIAVATTILNALQGFSIIGATAILKKCENALLQSVFNDAPVSAVAEHDQGETVLKQIE